MLGSRGLLRAALSPPLHQGYVKVWRPGQLTTHILPSHFKLKELPCELFLDIRERCFLFCQIVRHLSVLWRVRRIIPTASCEAKCDSEFTPHCQGSPWFNHGRKRKLFIMLNVFVLVGWSGLPAFQPVRRSSRPDWLMNVPAGHCEQAPVLQTGVADIYLTQFSQTTPQHPFCT